MSQELQSKSESSFVLDDERMVLDEDMQKLLPQFLAGPRRNAEQHPHSKREKERENR